MNEKERQRLLEDISAYIDGESDKPEAVECLIKTNAEAAKLYAELSRTSAHLKTLRAPDIHPAFATRVMAHIRETDDMAASGIPAWRRVVYGVLSAATASVLIAIAVWPFWPDRGITNAPDNNLNNTQLATVLKLRSQPEHALAADFGPLMADAEQNGAWSEQAESDPADMLVAGAPVTEGYVEVATKVATLLHSDTAEDDDDVFAALGSLSGPQAAALRVLLLNDVDEQGVDFL